MALRDRWQKRREDRKLKKKKRRGATASTPSGKRRDSKSRVTVTKEKPGFATEVERAPNTRIKPLPSDAKVDMKVDQPRTKPAPAKTKAESTDVPPRPKVTGKGDTYSARDVKTSRKFTGKRPLANVTREQIVDAGLDPNKKSDLKKYLNKYDELKRRPKKGDFRKGKIPSMYPEKKAGGGAVRKPAVPGYKKGGKVRGAGIAQRGVRPAKMR